MIDENMKIARVYVITWVLPYSDTILEIHTSEVKANTRLKYFRDSSTNDEEYYVVTEHKLIY